jgi:WG containing repeat
MKMKIFQLFFALLISLTSFSQEKFFTCINEKGERMFSIKAYSAYPFSDGMSQVTQSVLQGTKSKYLTGFMDETGQLVIPCIYDDVYSFAFGVTWVSENKDEGYYMINKKGERLTEKTWKKVGYFIEGFCAVYDEEGKMGFVNRKGEQVIPCLYTGDSFSEGLACVMPYDGVMPNYGFIDTTGAVVIPFQFDQAGTTSFDNGECRVQIKGVTCIINRKGEVIFKPTLTKNCMGFSCGLAGSYTNYATRSGWGFYNRNNQWVIQPKYDHAEDFKGGLAIVGIGDKYGVIDTTGKIIIPIQYEQIYAHAAEDGYFGLVPILNERATYVRADGSPFTTVELEYMTGSAEGKGPLAYTTPDGKGGYLNMDGTILIEAQFTRTMAFSEGKAWIWENVTSLPIAAGFSEANFAKEYVVGNGATCQKNGTGAFLKVSVDQITEYYYLVTFEDGTQSWVVYNQLKR